VRKKRGKMKRIDLYMVLTLQRRSNLCRWEGVFANKEGVRCPSPGHLAGYGRERE